MLWQPVKKNKHNSTHYETDRLFILETWDLDGKIGKKTKLFFNWDDLQTKKKNDRIRGIRFTAPFSAARFQGQHFAQFVFAQDVHLWGQGIWGVPEMGVHQK